FFLVGHVGGDALYLETVGAQSVSGALELLPSAGGDRQRVAFLTEDSGDRQPDAARRSRDQCRSLSQFRLLCSPVCVADPISSSPSASARVARRSHGAQ